MAESGSSSAPNRTHLIFALADHFEKQAIVPEDGQARAPYLEQEQRLERWCDEYPEAVRRLPEMQRGARSFTLISILRNNMTRLWSSAWPSIAGPDRGEIEIHLHHGVHAPDTAENTPAST